MPFIKTEIKDVIIFEPKVFKDSRGYFFESYNKKLFADNGIDVDFVQSNQSLSSFGTIRGLHFQKGDAAQAKLVRVIKGKVLDVAVDLRSNSPTFGLHVVAELSDENNHQLFIPRGFAHGFAVLSDVAIFSYQCDNFYSPADDSGILFNDAELAINWQIDSSKAIISDKDLKQESFAQYKENPCF